MKKTLEEISLSNGEYGGGFSAVEYFEGAPRYIRITDITDNGQLNDDIKAPSGNPKEWGKYILSEGDLLFARSGATVGKTLLYTSEYGECIYAGYLIRFRLNTKIAFPKYVYFFTKTPEYYSWVLKKQNVVAQPNINAKQYGQELEIPLPPLPLQQKIAAILDAADAYRQKTKALIDKYDQLAQSLFLDMFGDPVKNEKGWETKKLEDVCIKITDGTHFSPEPQNEGFPYVTAKHVKDYGLDFYSKPTFISEDAHNEIYKRCTPEFGDVLYIKDGATTGIACINTFKEPISLLSSLALLKLDKKVLINFFLCYWLNHKGIKEKLLREYMSGAAIQRYTLTKINSFVLTVPPVPLQNQFAERIQLIEAQKQQAQASLQKAEELFNSLLQSAFSGGLVG